MHYVTTNRAQHVNLGKLFIYDHCFSHLSNDSFLFSRLRIATIEVVSKLEKLLLVHLVSIALTWGNF